MPVLWFESAGVLGTAALLDFWIGDPWGWPHPVQAMGWGIQQYTQVVLQMLKAPVAQRLAGVVLALGLIWGTGFGVWGVVVLSRSIHSGLGWSVQIVLLASCFAGRSLRQAAEDVREPLQRGDLPTARQRLSLYVGRDTDTLDTPEILRAVLETLSENATDGVLAPLFYAILGAWLPGIGPCPLAMAYKAASTLDSMVGYRTAPYTDLGWCSARLEDGLTWLPCRLTVLTIALLSGQPRTVIALCWRDARADPSPNAGWSECAYAAALGVQLGGQNTYRGVVTLKPPLGEPYHPLTLACLPQAWRLTRRAFLLWLTVGMGGAAGLGFYAL